VIIAVNLVIHIVASMFGREGIEALWVWGALWFDEHTAGQFWRAFTHSWIHRDFDHVAANSLYLLLAGSMLEPAIGSQRFAMVYTMGIFGSLFPDVLAAMVEEPHVTAGASGAVSAVLGALLVVPSCFRLKRAVLVWLLVACEFVSEGVSEPVPGVAHGAHIAGFIFGMIAGAWAGRGATILHWKDHPDSPDYVPAPPAFDGPPKGHWYRLPRRR
jgi:rhomboid protease GluP